MEDLKGLVKLTVFCSTFKLVRILQVGTLRSYDVNFIKLLTILDILFVCILEKEGAMIKTLEEIRLTAVNP